jgi:two-component system, OmpR family, phosphate regulon sensor histidine kinase PhoR
MDIRSEAHLSSALVGLLSHPISSDAQIRTARHRRERAVLADGEVQRDNTETLAVAAHELRTPLATLTATVELLVDHPELEITELRDLVERLQRSVVWMHGVVENLDTWSALCDQRLTLERDLTSMRSVVESAVSVTQPLLGRREQRVHVDCPSAIPMIACDAQRVGQVIANLLTNASRYSDWADEIAITVRDEPAGLRVAIIDHGPGIALPDQQRIFDRYARGRSAGHAAAEGRGLGLHIVRQIIELHGGLVGVTSTPGSGATFWFTLPYHDPVGDIA